ncbi:MAG: septum formation initiator family protein [Candidatus Aminicenantales bacterium]
MTEKKEKNAFSLKKKIVVAAAAFLLLILFMTSLFGKKGWIEIYRARKNYNFLLQEIESLKLEKERLEKEIADLEKNAGAVEKTARGKLWLMKENEKVIVKKSK